ncbi:Conserved_hypothetical protein [Hexamita inflata]|uniref:Transmembrane protein n=1 Tax=Hexamita inflata TaxID=28002 RepID=A0AA86U4T8_9EUKA|nr:Conserved hypothetical protein [Hexamita inflata]
MLFVVFALSAEYQCFNEKVQLVGIESETAFYFTANVNQKCANYFNQKMKTVLSFQKFTLPTSMSTVVQFLQPGETVSVKFQLDAVNYNQIKENPSADYVISFNSQFYYPGVIPVIQHVSMDARRCWDNVRFSVDRDYAFNVSVVPLNCQIDKSISVQLEYFNISWISIPIVPTNPTGPFNGYVTGDFDISQVKFFNSSTNGDPTNALSIKKFVEYFKENINVQLRLKIQENNILQSIQFMFQAEITSFGNELSIQAQSSPTKCTIDTWYCFTQFSDHDQMLTTLNSIPGAINIHAQQYTYSQDKNFENNAQTTISIENLNDNGIQFNYGTDIEIKEEITYLYSTFIQVIDANGKMLAGLYYQGTTQKSCFSSMLFQYYNDKVCIKTYFKDTSSCRTRFSTNSILGEFVGKSRNINDVTKDQIYFRVIVNQQISESWIGRYNQICMTQSDQVLPTPNTSFQRRVYNYGQFIQKQNSNDTINCYFNSDNQLTIVTNFSNNIYSKALIWMILVSVIVVIITGISLSFVWKVIV